LVFGFYNKKLQLSEEGAYLSREGMSLNRPWTSRADNTIKTPPIAWMSDSSSRRKMTPITTATTGVMYVTEEATTLPASWMFL
jgi:hypothetical protein